MRWPVFAALFLFSALPNVSAAEEFSGEPKHFALVVGMEHYDEKGKLRPIPHACEDAQKVAARLETIWNQKVEPLCDLETSDLQARVRAFIQNVRHNPYSVSVMYFSGHGVQIDETSYLFGVDAKPDLDAEARSHETQVFGSLFLDSAISLYDDVIKKAGWVSNGGLVLIVDACRDDPILMSRSSVGSLRTISAPSTNTDVLPGILTAYATSKGKPAIEGPNGSIYANELEARLVGNQAIEVVLGQVAQKVAEKSFKADPSKLPQTPTKSGSVNFPCLTADCPNLEKAPSVLAPRAATEAAPVPAKVAWTHMAEPALLHRAAYQPGGPAVPNASKGEVPRPLVVDIYDRDDPAAREGLTLEIFWCEGGEGSADRFDQAVALADAVKQRRGSIAGTSGLDSIRIKQFNVTANSKSGFRYLENAAIYDDGDPTEKSLAEALSGLGSTPVLAMKGRGRSRGYVGVFICAPPKPTAKTDVYWQVPSEGDVRFAKTLEARIDEKKLGAEFIKGVQYRAIPPATAWTPPQKTDVRFYFPEDQAAAFTLADSLERLLGHPVNIGYFWQLAKRSKPGTIEAWIGKDEGRSVSSDRKPGRNLALR